MGERAREKPLPWARKKPPTGSPTAGEGRGKHPCGRLPSNLQQGWERGETKCSAFCCGRCEERNGGIRNVYASEELESGTQSCSQYGALSSIMDGAFVEWEISSGRPVASERSLPQQWLPYVQNPGRSRSTTTDCPSSIPTRIKPSPITTVHHHTGAQSATSITNTKC